MIGGGADAIFTIVPVIVGIVFVIVIGSLVFKAAAGTAEWMNNNSLPISRVNAVVLNKRVETQTRSSGGGCHGHANHHIHSSSTVSTYNTYYMTFENSDTRERHVFSVKQNVFDTVVEDDLGTLVYQGTRFHGFELS